MRQDTVGLFRPDRQQGGCALLPFYVPGHFHFCLVLACPAIFSSVKMPGIYRFM
jgi:hypothetical protein